ncbi:pyridoxal phosphate-dependent aminotransferase [Pseudobacter ginsenosidimutans]|uniref:Histidinol-phosphate aminotransferase n=1 Tax=Pseudobacter ginsenosidimutans TaxID=661488 RepID=A0A4Q7N5D2_9BACT|nr:histidinol-phosphate transaminase [Pseudobacter ginsenosidimutans]QEC44771.1 histidinol-phosphate aminotransferase family protein [Pseudobacter ginsenosidimutans]RZS76255.1 histidinol-phosphate aminotransferase [Pseudobacter ginsenosidimutans]
MPANRRTWLKQIGWGMAGLGIAPLQSFAVTESGPHEALFPQDDSIRLSSNENPYGPSPAVIAAMTAALSLSNRYNWQYSSDLMATIAKKHQLDPGNIMISAGSTEILDLQARYFGEAKGSFVISETTYSNWSSIAENAGYKKITVPLNAEKKQDLASMLSAIRTDTNMLYLCNPNNPTGTLIPDRELVSFITEATKKVTVVIDEAYLDYTEQSSAARLVPNNKNLIIVKTFSKIYGLAGARIGYALMHEELTEKISSTKTWANGDISVASRAAAMAALQDTAFTKKCRELNEQVRTDTMRQLQQLNFACIPSFSNFIYFSTEKHKTYFEQLKRSRIQGTYVYEKAGEWTRITVGTAAEMKQFIAAVSS